MYQIGVFSEDKAVWHMLQACRLPKHPLKLYQYFSKMELEQEAYSGAVLSDILILDIRHMQDGIVFAKNIQGKDRHVRLIFITDTTNEISYIFETEPTYLLVKPFSKIQLSKAIEKAITQLQANEKKFLALYIRDKLIRIPLQEIYYIQSDRRYLMIYQQKKIDTVTMKLSAMMEKLPDYFIRCHQSYVVNICKIIKLEKNQILLENGSLITISRNRLEVARNAILKYFTC